MTNFTLFVCLFVTKCNSSGQDYLLCNFNRVTARQWSIQLPATLPNSPRYVKNLQLCLFGVWGVTVQCTHIVISYYSAQWLHRRQPPWKQVDYYVFITGHNILCAPILTPIFCEQKYSCCTTAAQKQSRQV